VAKQEQKRKRKSTKKKTESTMSIEIVMAILILIQLLAIFKLGFLGRTPRGRVATKLAYEHLGISQTGK